MVGRRTGRSRPTSIVGGPHEATTLPLVSAIVVHHSANSLNECLESLLATSYPALEVILVLNGVAPNRAVAIRQRWGSRKRVRILELNSNLGYGGGANAAFAHARGDYLAVLNDDLEFDPHWLDPLVQVMQDDTDVGACQPKLLSRVCPVLYDYAGAAGGMLDFLGYPFARGRVFWTVEEDRGQYDDICDVLWVSGAAMVVRRSAWERVGGFDPLFFLYAEEIDFCWQLHRLGYRAVCVPSARIYHWGSLSTSRLDGGRVFWISRNHLLLLLKNYTVGQVVYLFPLRVGLELVNALYALVIGQPHWAVSILRALWSVLCTLKAVQRSRQQRPRGARRAGNGAALAGYSVVFEYFVRKRRTYAQMNGAKSRCAYRELKEVYHGDYHPG